MRATSLLLRVRVALKHGVNVTGESITLRKDAMPGSLGQSPQFNVIRTSTALDPAQPWLRLAMQCRRENSKCNRGKS
jgi:hypothetical protein